MNNLVIRPVRTSEPIVRKTFVDSVAFGIYLQLKAFCNGPNHRFALLSTSEFSGPTSVMHLIDRESLIDTLRVDHSDHLQVRLYVGAPLRPSGRVSAEIDDNNRTSCFDVNT